MAGCKGHKYVEVGRPVNRLTPQPMLDALERIHGLPISRFRCGGSAKSAAAARS
jgi:hypothetical protein